MSKSILLLKCKNLGKLPYARVRHNFFATKYSKLEVF